MEKRLCDAAIAGDVTTLSQLLQDDPLVLDKASLNCEDKNPLHLAAMLGHVEFVKSILQVHHSADYMCFSRDRDGRNPVHLAAMCGKLDVLEVLIQASHRAAMEKTDGGGTILHLCVKHNQLRALMMLLPKLKDPEFINAKNEDGMTILHLAIYYDQNQDQYQTIIYLLHQIDARNDRALIDRLWAKGAVDLRIRRFVVEMAIKSFCVAFHEKAGNAMMVVASLIATMAFQAGISPPGGVWQDDLKEGPNPHRAGEAVMAQTHPKYYRHMVRANTVAFVSSLSTIVLMFTTGSGTKYFLPPLALTMCAAIATTATTYGISLVTVVPKDIRGQLSETTIIVLTVLMVWSGHMIYMLLAVISSCRIVLLSLLKLLQKWFMTCKNILRS